MISYIKGRLAEVDKDSIVVEAASIGIEIHVPLSVVQSLPHIGEDVMIYTYLKVSEDALTLYGFNSRRDLNMFCQLIGVSGIGPKGALAILSTLSPDELRIAVLSSDSASISKAPGIGAKTAQRVIIDLKDKISMEDIMTLADGGDVALPFKAAQDETLQALIALGYSSAEAARAVRGVKDSSEMDSETLLKAALKQMALL